MMKIIIPILILIGGIVSYPLYYPPVVQKRAVARALEEFSDTVASKDAPKVKAALERLLSDGAKIKLEVNFLSITQQERPPLVQEFDKAQFITFIDNTLYTLTDYSYTPRLNSVKRADDKQSSQVFFSSREWGDGSNIYGGTTVQMRFSSETKCEATAVFEPSGNPRLTVLSCAMQFRSIPKPEEIGKMQNMDALKDLLIKN